jgi:trigger factor
VATFEVVPDFGEIDVSKLSVVRHTAEVGEDDIDRMIENLRLQRRTWRVVERGAQDGDRSTWRPGRRRATSACPPKASEKGRTVLGSRRDVPGRG